MEKTVTNNQPREIRIYRRYFDMIADGRKTVEVRVGYNSMRRVEEGDILRFVNGNDHVDREVVRVSEYASFAEMMEAENPEAINPEDSADDQLAAIRKIYPPKKEKQFGVLAFELAPVEDAED